MRSNRRIEQLAETFGQLENDDDAACRQYKVLDQTFGILAASVDGGRTQRAQLTAHIDGRVFHRNGLLGLSRNFHGAHERNTRTKVKPIKLHKRNRTARKGVVARRFSVR